MSYTKVRHLKARLNYKGVFRPMPHLTPSPAPHPSGWHSHRFEAEQTVATRRSLRVQRWQSAQHISDFHFGIRANVRFGLPKADIGQCPLCAHPLNPPPRTTCKISRDDHKGSLGGYILRRKMNSGILRENVSFSRWQASPFWPYLWKNSPVVG